MYIKKGITKVYILSPFYKTGGPRSLHQLADVLVNQGLDVNIVYYKNGLIYNAPELLFSECKATISTMIEDNKNNILITSEYYTEILKKYRNIQKCIWWLSLDFYLNNMLYYRARFRLRKKGLPVGFLPLVILYQLIFKRNEHSKAGIIKSRDSFSECFHMYNCEYVRLFLKRKGVLDSQMRYLCGPLEKEYINVDKNQIFNQKKNIVVYNPAKINRVFLKKIINEVNKKNTNIEFIGIENMSRYKVYNTLLQAKVYIDFGYFPGPERMPREAVSLYCNIITSKIGSAENNIDVPIERKYKFSIRNSCVKDIALFIIQMCKDYENYVSDYNVYRDKVIDQVIRFEKDIKEIFR